MATQNLSAQATEGNSHSSKFCKHCHGPLDTEEIRWRLKFLAFVAGYLHKMEPIEEDECCGLMFLLNDIADMVNPPSEKEGAA